MTSYQSTPSFVHLDHEDVDGLIDIARYGLPPLADNPATINLIERLANTIATGATGLQIKRTDYDANHLEDDETLPGGMAIFQVWPIDGIYNNMED